MQKQLSRHVHEVHVFFAALWLVVLEEIKEAVEEGYFSGQVRSLVDCRVHKGKQTLVVKLDALEDGVQGGEGMRGHQCGHSADDLSGARRKPIEQPGLFLPDLVVVNGEVEVAEPLLADHMQIDIQLHLESKAIYQPIQLKGHGWVTLVVLDGWQDVPLDEVSGEASHLLDHLRRLHRDPGVFGVADAPEDAAELGEGGLLGEDVRPSDVQHLAYCLQEVVAHFGALPEAAGWEVSEGPLLGEVAGVADDLVNGVDDPLEQHPQRGNDPRMVHEVQFQPMPFHESGEALEVVDEYHLIEKLQFAAEGQFSPQTLHHIRPSFVVLLPAPLYVVLMEIHVHLRDVAEELHLGGE